MNIAYLCGDFGIPIHGNKGASIHVRELSHALNGLGHRVEIIAPRTGGRPAGDAPDDFGVPVHSLGLSQHDKHLFGLLREDPAGGELVAKEIRSMLYATWLRHAALPLLREFGPDAIYERYALLATAGSALARDLGVPHILEVNAPLSAEQALHRGSVFSQTARAIEQTVLSSATHVIAVSDALKEWMVGIGVLPERITVVPNGVDVERFAGGGIAAKAVRQRHGLVGSPVIGFVGTLKAWHGTANLVRAVALIVRDRDRANPPRLLIVGDGPERGRLEALAREEGIGGLTTFTGSVDHGDVPAHVAAMDIVTAPYDEMPDDSSPANHYFSPLKLFEYMASGRPIVAAGIGQIANCISDGETGLLYRPGDVSSLASQITRLLDNPDLGETLGRAAQGLARERYSWSGNARTVVGLIETAVQQRTGTVTQQGSGPVAAGPVPDAVANPVDAGSRPVAPLPAAGDR